MGYYTEDKSVLIFKPGSWDAYTVSLVDFKYRYIGRIVCKYITVHSVQQGSDKMSVHWHVVVNSILYIVTTVNQLLYVFCM